MHVTKSAAAIVVFAVVTLSTARCLPAGAQWWSGHGASGNRASGTYHSPATSTIFSGKSLDGDSHGAVMVPAGTVFGSPGLSPAPGVSSSTGNGISPGMFSYYNNAGLGYYRANPTASHFPAYMSPVSLGGGYYQLGGLTERVGYWRAPSGYYYPWFPAVYMPGVKYGPAGTVYQIQDGLFAPAHPSVGQALADMREYVEVAKDRKQIDAGTYQNLYRRVNELTQKATDWTAADGGALTPEHDVELRKQIDLLSADLSRALNP